MHDSFPAAAAPAVSPASSLPFETRGRVHGDLTGNLSVTIPDSKKAVQRWSLPEPRPYFSSIILIDPVNLPAVSLHT